MKPTPQRTPKELIELYWEEVWNKGRAELIREICSEPLMRYDVGSSVTPLSHDEQIARVRTYYEKLKPRFTHEILIADDRHAVSVWNLFCEVDASFNRCGIEVFRAEGGRLVACWNTPYSSGRWGCDGDRAVPTGLAPPTILAGANGITADWVQRVLSAALPDVPRVNLVFGVEPIGNGTTSSTYRATYGFSEVETKAPISMIVKLPPTNPQVLASVSQLGCYERETKAYQLFVDAPFRLPRAYFVASAGAASFTVAIEDLGGRGTPGNQIDGCSVAEAEAVVRESALLHRTYWRKPEIDDLSWPLRLANMSQTFSQAYAAGAAELAKHFTTELGPDIDLINAVAPLVEAWCRRPVTHRTLIHGDMRVDNIFFEHDSGQLRACFIDLQQIAIGDPHFDLAYFLTGSLDPAIRRDCERRLIVEHAHVIAAVDATYDEEDAWENYRGNAISGLLATVLSASIITHSDHNEKMLLALVRRNCTAVRELDGVDAAQRLIASGKLSGPAMSQLSQGVES